MKLRNSNYQLDGFIGYEHRDALLRLAEKTGMKPEAIVSFALQRLFMLPDEGELLREYQRHLDDLQLESVYPA